MKLNEYFTDVLTHSHIDKSPRDASPHMKQTLAPSALTAVCSMRQSPEKVRPSPIRMHDTHRSTLVMGEREPVTQNASTVKREYERAGKRSMTPVHSDLRVIDHQLHIRNDFREFYEQAKIARRERSLISIGPEPAANKETPRGGDQLASKGIKFTPIKRDFYKIDRHLSTAPIHGEVEAETTKQISSAIQ
jgi:hypothetical protein